MSVLHQNAASLVTTRAAHNGPNQVGQVMSVLYQNAASCGDHAGYTQ